MGGYIPYSVTAVTVHVYMHSMEVTKKVNVQHAQQLVEELQHLQQMLRLV